MTSVALFNNVLNNYKEKWDWNKRLEKHYKLILTDFYSILYSTIAKYKIFSSTHVIFSRIDHMLGFWTDHKTRLSLKGLKPHKTSSVTTIKSKIKNRRNLQICGN